MAGGPGITKILFFVSLTIICSFSQTGSVSSGLRVEVIPRDHPTSPLYDRNISKLERRRKLHKFSEARSSYLLSVATRNVTRNLIQVRLRLRLANYYSYVVELEMGNPPTTLYLLLDTGSSLTWTQCKPCDNCYPQSIDTKMYDSRSSGTYLKIPSNHRSCSGVNPFFQNSNDECVYSVGYGGHCKTSGVGSFEIIRVSPEIVFKDVIFGCSRSSQAKCLHNTKISGILGLGDSSISIVSQFSDVFKGTYSYCFGPYNAQPHPFYLTIGDSVPKMSPRDNFETINVIRSLREPELFYLDLVDISVGSTSLGFSPNAFKIRNDGTGGLLIDSGTIIPRLDATIEHNVYGRVLALFQVFYILRGVVRIIPDEETDYKLCFRYKKNFNDYATMTYHFKGGHDYIVEKQFTNFFNNEKHYFCPAIVAGHGLSILGAWHQQNKRIIFDVQQNQLHYASQICTN